ncbi:MAG TPA: 2Fe-2S iron-sulfur cluster-binding protein [Bacteriovoracaceae bacterium]|nr:2Fe-2S iron-sulfur cluster-binding protein [Bacteriovoracaceae bacterium]
MTLSKCTLWPSGEVLELNNEESLLTQLKKAGKKIKSSCGGCATCTDCMIVVKSGELNLSPQTFEELRLLGNVFHITKERLSCQTKILGDVTLDISAHEKNPIASKESVPKSTITRLKKREDIEKAVRESEEKNQANPSDTWYRHWESEGEDSDKPKRLGGNKRPKPFNFNDSGKDNKDK